MALGISVTLDVVTLAYSRLNNISELGLFVDAQLHVYASSIKLVDQ